MTPQLRSLLARVVLVGGVAFVGTHFAKNAPHDQSIGVRLGGREVTRISGVVTQEGEREATAGFSQDFSAAFPAPRVVRHSFSAPNGTYIVVINCTERVPLLDGEGEGESDGNHATKLIETSFERRVSLAGGEVIVSPD